MDTQIQKNSAVDPDVLFEELIKKIAAPRYVSGRGRQIRFITF